MLRLYILVVPSSSGMGDPHAVANIGGFSCPHSQLPVLIIEYHPSTFPANRDQ